MPSRRAWLPRSRGAVRATVAPCPRAAPRCPGAGAPVRGPRRGPGRVLNKLVDLAEDQVLHRLAAEVADLALAAARGCLPRRFAARVVETIHASLVVTQKHPAAG